MQIPIFPTFPQVTDDGPERAKPAETARMVVSPGDQFFRLVAVENSEAGEAFHSFEKRSEGGDETESQALPLDSLFVGDADKPIIVVSQIPMAVALNDSGGADGASTLPDGQVAEIALAVPVSQGKVSTVESGVPAPHVSKEEPGGPPDRYKRSTPLGIAAQGGALFFAAWPLGKDGAEGEPRGSRFAAASPEIGRRHSKDELPVQSFPAALQGAENAGPDGTSRLAPMGQHAWSEVVGGAAQTGNSAASNGPAGKGVFQPGVEDPQRTPAIEPRHTTALRADPPIPAAHAVVDGEETHSASADRLRTAEAPAALPIRAREPHEEGAVLPKTAGAGPTGAYQKSESAASPQPHLVVQTRQTPIAGSVTRAPTPTFGGAKFAQPTLSAREAGQTTDGRIGNRSESAFPSAPVPMTASNGIDAIRSVGRSASVALGPPSGLAQDDVGRLTAARAISTIPLVSGAGQGQDAQADMAGVRQQASEAIRTSAPHALSHRTVASVTASGQTATPSDGPNLQRPFSPGAEPEPRLPQSDVELRHIEPRQKPVPSETNIWRAPDLRPADPPVTTGTGQNAASANLAAAVSMSQFDPEAELAAEPDLPIADIRGDRPVAVAAAPSPASTAHPETPRAVIHQIAEGIRNAHDQAIDLKLHPEELGRVRMTLTMDQGHLSVALTADRSDTLDLLRRNIDMLAVDLRRIGYGSVDFTFGDGRQQPGAGTNSFGAPSDERVEAPVGLEHPDQLGKPIAERLPPSGGGVDIRI